MAGGDAVLLLELLFEQVAEHAGLDVHDVRLGVEAGDPVESADVQDDTAEDGQRGAGDVGAARGRGDRNARLVADPQHGRDLVGVGGLDEHGVRGRGTALGLADHRTGPPVTGPGDDLVAGGVHRVRGLAQRLDDGIGDRDRVDLKRGLAVADRGVARPLAGAGGTDGVVAPVERVGDGLTADHAAVPSRSTDFS